MKQNNYEKDEMNEFLFKLRLFIITYWMRILVFLGLLVLGISMVALILKGLRAWNEAESYLRQSQLAMIPLQLYLQLVMALIFGVIYTFLMYWMMYRRGASTFTQAKKKAVRGKEIQVTWNDVIGMDEAKQEALEVVNLIKDRAELKRIGGQILRGLLMMGPPGCGKTYLAKAIATEANLPFISMSGAEFVEMFVGVGSSRVRSLFKEARMQAQFQGGCIIFIDELDALGAKRALDAGFGGTTEHNTTLNQLLVEMDGLKDKEANIVVIGATNAPERHLDPALLRPGRFDRKFYVDMPNLEDRQKLFEYYLKKVKYDPESVKIDRLARWAVSHSPADISNLVREASLLTVRRKKLAITMQEFTDAEERITVGVLQRMKLTDEDKWQVAYHEAGHAIATYLLAPHKDVFKATIIPRGGYLGYVSPREREERHIHSREYYLADIMISLGSYAAEKMRFGSTTSGVTADFQSAMANAHSMVWRWGMGRSGLLGNFQMFWERGDITGLISEETKARLDQDVQDILRACLKEVEDLLAKERPLLDRFAQELFQKEELNYDEIEAVFKSFGKQRAQ